MSNLPDCFCNEKEMSSCNWQFKMDIGYKHMESENTEEFTNTTYLENIPQPLAQVLCQTFIDVTNRQGMEVYAAWMQGCFDGDDLEAMTKRVRAMVVK